MKRIFILSFLFLLIFSAMFADADNREIVINELTPAEDLFSGFEAPKPYELTLRDLFLKEHRYRKCQIVCLPSFEKEWAIYLIREHDKSQMILKIMKKQLWDEMMKVLSGNDTKGSFSLDEESQKSALDTLPKEVERFSKAISENTADILEQVWILILLRARYPEKTSLGMDGTHYSISHYDNMHYYSGTTWSPEKNTIPADLAAIGESIKEFLNPSEKDKKITEQDIVRKATQLIEKIEKTGKK